MYGGVGVGGQGASSSGLVEKGSALGSDPELRMHGGGILPRAHLPLDALEAVLVEVRLHEPLLVLVGLKPVLESRSEGREGLNRSE